MYRLYDYLPSGNGYKVRLVLRALNLPYELIEVDIKNGATRTAQFREKNPNGKIPVPEVPGHGYLSESHAIISYLAEHSWLVPQDRYARAQMTGWMCFEQYSLEPHIGTARYWLCSLHLTPNELGEKLVDKMTKGHEALAVLERELSHQDYLVNNSYSLADIALHAYTHVAPEAGFDLDPYPSIRRWIAAIENQPHWAPITAP